MIPQSQGLYSRWQQKISFRTSRVIYCLAVLLFAFVCNTRTASSQNIAPASISMQALLTLKALPSNLHSSSGILTVAFSPDGKRILTGSYDNRAIVWDAQNGREILSLPGLKYSIFSVAFSPDGNRIATGERDYGDRCSACIWNAATGQKILTIKGHSTSINSIAFSSDGNQLLTANATPFDVIQNIREDNTASLWDATTGHETLVLKAHHYEINSAVFSPDGKHILTNSEEGTAKVWETDTGKLVLTIQLQPYINFISAAAFSPDGNFIVTVGGQHERPGEVNFWDASSGKKLWTVKDPRGHISCVAFGPDGSWLVMGNQNGTASIRDAKTGQELFTLIGHTSAISSVAVSADGKRIVTGSYDTTARVWQTPLRLFQGKKNSL